jgi:hypothetical protein
VDEFPVGLQNKIRKNTMSNGKLNGVNWSFWAISFVALIWNVMGGINFLMQINAEMVASMPETHRTIIEGRPGWATAGFAVAVFGGAIGCFLLLLRKSVAVYVFTASLLGVIVAHAHTLALAIDFSLLEVIMMVAMPLVVAAFLIWYARWAEGKGWIG